MRLARLGLAAALCLGAGSQAALGATRITVSSVAGTLGAGGSGQCTLRDALVIADQASNPALRTNAEPGGRGAAGDCSGRSRGRGAPYTVILAAKAKYTLDQVDNYWFGPDGLAPISARVTIVGNGATIAGSALTGPPHFRFFYVAGGLSGIPAGNLTLRDLTLSGGLARGGSSSGSGGGAGMGGAIFVEGKLALARVTLTQNVAQGGSGNDAAAGSGGGGIGSSSPASGAGGGFGGPAPGAHGGAGGPASYSGSAGGGGGFRPGDRGARGGKPGGVGSFGSDGGDGGGGGSGDDDNGAGGSFGHGGGAPYIFSGPHGESGDGVGGGGGGGVGGGAGAGSESTGAGGGFGGGGGQAGCGSGGCPADDGGFGGGGAGPGAGAGNSGSAGGFGGGSGVNSDGSGDGGGGAGGAGMGGAVFSLFGTVRVSDSTLAENSALGGPGDGSTTPDGSVGDGLGGAIFNLDGSLAVAGSTITHNLAVDGNPAGGGVYTLAFGNSITRGSATVASTSLAGSILYGNTGAGGAEDDLAVTRVPGRHANLSTSRLAGVSIVGATSTVGGAHAMGMAITGDPLLGPLQDNGGALATIKPAAGSPALGAGTSCDATDELGTPRPPTGCDLGALEQTPAG